MTHHICGSIIPISEKTPFVNNSYGLIFTARYHLSIVDLEMPQNAALMQRSIRSASSLCWNRIDIVLVARLAVAVSHIPSQTNTITYRLIRIRANIARILEAKPEKNEQYLVEAAHTGPS